MFIDNIKLCFKIIFKNKFRSLFMIFGITIIYFTLSFSFFFVKHMQSKFLNNLEKMGVDFIKLKTSSFSDDFKHYLTFDDINSLKNSTLGIKHISPEVFIKGKIDNKLVSLSSYIIGGTEDYFDFMSMDLIKGRFFNKHECVNRENVVLIDNFTSLKLYGTIDSMGKYINIQNENGSSAYRIIGVVTYPSRIFEENNNIPSFCIIPINSYIHRLNHNRFFEYIYISYYKDENIYSLSKSIINFMKVRKGIFKDVYQIEAFITQENRFRNIENIFNSILKFIGCIFFLFLGFNIISTMFFNINNRIEEIYLRKKLGASNFDIFIQFLTESLILCFVGGILGELFFMIFKTVLGLNYSISFFNLIYILLLLIFVSILFGIFPAFKASKIMSKD